IFKAVDGKYTIGENDYKKFGTPFPDVEIITGCEKDGEKLDLKSPIKKVYTIINAKAVDDRLLVIDTEKKIIGTESLELKDGTLSYNTTNEAREEKISSDKRYILNGITNTLKVSGEQNELNDSIINAYETAVVMDGNMSMLTLNDSVVNGGFSNEDGAIPTINITGNGNTLTIQGNSTINGATITKDDKVNVITVKGENNAVTLEGNTIVNGKMESVGNNTLNLYGKVNRDSNESSMNILHDVTGFINMNIENNVTFYEDVKVTGTETVTVHKNGVLNLRLKKEGEEAINTLSNDIPVAVHAFSDRDGKHKMTIKGTSEGEAGTLNFITNGIGKKIDVDMKNIELENMIIKASSIIDKAEIDGDYIHLGAGSDLSGIVNPKVSKYDSFNEIYKSLYSSTGENLDALRDMLSMTFLGRNYDYNNATDEEQLKILMTYLNSIYTGTPYSYSSELSRRSAGMFRDIITENQFRPDLNRWLVMGGLTHRDGGTKDSYYGQNYHGFDTGTADVDVDMKLTGAYALGKYGYSENVSLGVTAGGNRSEAKLPMSKVKGNSGYIGAFAENYRGNLTLKAGAGIQYSEYNANRATLGGHSYSDKYSDMTYDIYLNGRYSHNIGENLFLEPYGTLSYTYIKQDSADEGNKVLAIETDSKSFDYTAAKVGVDIKKVIPHEKGKSTLSAGVSYTRLLTGADEENITGRFKGKDATNFDILVAHKNEHSIELNAKYTLELESGILFDVKGSYNVERDSHNGSEKNRNKGEWIVGAGLGYKF
ncbi:MAG: autotransporter outer membrane beta-barrel domain-containing protein, partial [Fusobacterium varium]|uniref:autotransporter family protein n=1 Tax=Fusobacterium varium TaxID=856 RepID=UPI003996B1B8